MRALLLVLFLLLGSTAQADLLFFQLDDNRDGKVAREESGPLRSEFDRWDRNGDGLLSYGDFRRILMADAGFDHRTHKDLAYANVSERQRLDLYLPPRSSRGKSPVLVWIHGGGWKAGDKYPCPVRNFVDDGYAVASLNYRYSTQATFPAQLQDCRAALRWLREHQLDYDLDPDRIFVAGSSAGGHLSLLLHDQGVAGICALCAPSDLTALYSPTLEELVGGPLDQHAQLLVEASPLKQNFQKTPPVLLIHGTQDTLVTPTHSLQLAERLVRAHAWVELFLVPGAGHGLIGGRETLTRLRSFMNTGFSAGADQASSP